MSKTIIYSCGSNITSCEFLENLPDCSYHFPEVDSEGVPYCEHNLPERAKQFIGTTFCTFSPVILLAFFAMIAKGELKADDVELYCNNRRIGISDTGEVTDDWDGGFFTTGFDLVVDMCQATANLQKE